MSDTTSFDGWDPSVDFDHEPPFDFDEHDAFEPEPEPVEVAAPAIIVPLVVADVLARRYWRWAAMVYPNGVPPGFELCRAFRSEWSPS